MVAETVADVDSMKEIRYEEQDGIGDVVQKYQKCIDRFYRLW
jgi:hypothetical protein